METIPQRKEHLVGLLNDEHLDIGQWQMVEVLIAFIAIDENSTRNFQGFLYEFFANHLQQAEFEGELMPRREKLTARIEVCDELWRHMVRMKTRVRQDSNRDAALRGIKYMMEVVEAHRSTAQESLVGIGKG